MRKIFKEATARWASRLALVLAGIAACLVLAGPVAAPAAAGGVSVTLYGGAGAASGAGAILEFQGRTWLVDCGAFQPEGAGNPALREDAAAEKNQLLPREAIAVRGVFISHAHLDHIGRLPLLVHQGYRGPVYMTEATASIARVMLRTQIIYDTQRVRRWIWSARSAAEKRNIPIHWMAECESARMISARNRRERQCPFSALEKGGMRPRPCSKCLYHELSRLAHLIKIVEWGAPVAVDGGVFCTFFPAGHIPGAASILVTCRTQGETWRLLFSGDLGNDLSPLIAAPPPAPPADVVFVEATYGARVRTPEDGNTEAFRRDLARAAAEKKVIWIPAFALDRTQKILHQIVIAQGQGLLDPLMRVSCPSRTAAQITGIYRSAIRERQQWFRPEIEGHPEVLSPPGLTDRLPPISSPGTVKPIVLITAAAMMQKNGSSSLLETLFPRPDVEIFFVGWQDPSSPAGQVQAGRSEVRVAGRIISRKASVHDYRCFSGHGDAHDIDRWLAPVNKTAVLIVMHGDENALRNRAGDLQAKGWTDVRVAKEGSTLHFPGPGGTRSGKR